MIASPHSAAAESAASPQVVRVTVVVTQRERFGMTDESLKDLSDKMPGVRLVYIDGNSPPRWRDYLAAQAEARGFDLVRTEHFLTPNEARNIGIARARADLVAFCDNDVLYTEGWLDRLIDCADETGADVAAPLTCQALPAPTEIHHRAATTPPAAKLGGSSPAIRRRAARSRR